MALYPCQSCQQRYPGDARNVYLTTWYGDDKMALRMAICPSCFDGMTAGWMGHAFHRDAHGDWAEPDPDETVESILSGLTPLPASGKPRKVS